MSRRSRRRPTAHRSNLPDSALRRGRFCQPRSVTLHDELRELVDTFGEGLLGDADQFRAALDDYLPENAALPGQLNVLYDAVRFGAYARCVELLARGSDPMLAVGTAGDLLARERGTTEVITSRWAVATLAHATGHLATDALSVFLQPDTAGGPVQDLVPSVPTPSGPPPGSPPPGPPPSYPPPRSIPPPPSVPPPTANPVPPPPTYVPPVETAAGAPPSWPTSEQPPEPAQASTPAPPPTSSEPVPEDPAAASSTPVQPQTVTAPLGRVAVPAPPGSSRDEPSRRRSRRAGLIAAAAAAAVVAAGVGTYLVVADGDDDTGRTDREGLGRLGPTIESHDQRGHHATGTIDRARRSEAQGGPCVPVGGLHGVGRGRRPGERPVGDVVRRWLDRDRAGVRGADRRGRRTYLCACARGTRRGRPARCRPGGQAVRDEQAAHDRARAQRCGMPPGRTGVLPGLLRLRPQRCRVRTQQG